MQTANQTSDRGLSSTHPRNPLGDTLIALYKVIVAVIISCVGPPLPLGQGPRSPLKSVCT